MYVNSDPTRRGNISSALHPSDLRFFRTFNFPTYTLSGGQTFSLSGKSDPLDV